MSIIGALTGGAGVQTIFNLDDVPEYVLVGDTVTDLPITSFAVSIAGDQKINIVGQSLCQAFSKWKMEGALGASVKVSQLLRVSDGGARAKTQLIFTNAGATTPNVYAFAKREASGVNRGLRFKGISINAAMVGLNATSNGVFRDFLALFFDAANLDSIQINWLNTETKKSWSNRLVGVEAAAMFAIDNEGDANAKLATITCVDNSKLLMADQNPGIDPNIIQDVTIYTTSGGAMSVLVVSASTY